MTKQTLVIFPRGRRINNHCFGATSDCLFFFVPIKRSTSCLLQSCMYNPTQGAGFNSDRKYTNNIITLKYCYLYTLKPFQIWTDSPTCCLNGTFPLTLRLRLWYIRVFSHRQAGRNK